MNREILFRGKRIDDDELVYGFLLCYADGDCTIAVPQKDLSMLQYRVSAESCGQYTGLTDKNGTRIFEGDIVRHYNNSTDEMSYEVGTIYWNNEESTFRRTRNVAGADPVLLHYTCCYEVIGNIHDNPELLERSAQ